MKTDRENGYPYPCTDEIDEITGEVVVPTNETQTEKRKQSVFICLFSLSTLIKKLKKIFNKN